MSENNKRLRLYGKPATKEQIAKEVSNLLLGNFRKGIEPQNITQICRTLSFDSRQSIYIYKELAVKLGYLELDKDGKAKLPEKTSSQAFKKFNEKNPLSNDPLIADWVQNMLTRKQGAPIKSWRTRLTNLTKWLNTLKINPEQLLVSKEVTDKYQTNFLQLFQQGKADTGYKKDPSKTDISGVAYRYSQAYRDFMNFHGLPYPKNYGGVSSQKVVGHGKFSDVMLSDEEILKAKNYLIEKYGICSDEFRFFMMGVESCGRHKAVFEMTLDYKVEEFQGHKAYIFEQIETKTIQYRGGKWKKYVTDPELQKSIDDLKAKGINRLNEEDLTQTKLADKIRASLFDLYKFLGKETVHDGYFMDHFFHVLRHVGAHYWLRRTKYNHSIVAMIGGWKIIQELIDSYGEVPPDMILELIFGEKKV